MLWEHNVKKQLTAYTGWQGFTEKMTLELRDYKQFMVSGSSFLLEIDIIIIMLSHFYEN